jgi:hypothetical protein
LFTRRFKLHFIQFNVRVDLKELSVAQSWGDYVDVLQAALFSSGMLSCLSLICWLGNELSEEVRITGTFTYTSQMRIHTKTDNLHNISHNYNFVQILTG